VSLPEFSESGNLPAGEYECTWKELEASFGTSFKRKSLLQELHYVVNNLTSFGVETLYIDGSFVTSKDRPRDVEVVYMVPKGADNSQWGLFSPVQHDLLKRMRHIDLWPYPSPQRIRFRDMTILEFFSQDRDGSAKGIVLLNLEGYE
jgi:hypothetical protein